MDPELVSSCGSTPLKGCSPPSQRIHKEIKVKVMKVVPLDTVPEWVKEIALMVFNLTRSCEDIEISVNFDFSQLTTISKDDRKKITNYLEDEIFNLELA